VYRDCLGKPVSAPSSSLSNALSCHLTDFNDDGKLDGTVEGEGDRDFSILRESFKTQTGD